MLLVRDGTVVDAERTVAADVAVEDGRITAVEDDLDPAPADRTIDAGGRYVAPGLIDAHVHLFMDGRPDPTTVREQGRYSGAYRAAAHLETLLAAGVTTVRDLGAPGTLTIDAREAVEDGVIDGPRVLAAAQNVTMTGGHAHWFGREADGETEVRTAAREQLKRGADVIKGMATGGVLTEGAVTGAPELDERELAALVDVAHAKGRPAAAHAHGATGIKNAVRAGIDSVEHGTYMDREAAELMAETGTYWVPTASALYGIVDHGTEAGIPEYAVEKAEATIEAFDAAFEYALDAGVPIAMGTDAGTPFNFHGDNATELVYLVEHGLDPEAALAAATADAADLLGLADLGFVREGYRADLVVLEDDPSSTATAWADPVHVIARGKPVA